MKLQNFESWLQDYHANKIDEGSADGDMLLASYEKWVEQLDSQEMMDFAFDWGKSLRIEVVKFFKEAAIEEARAAEQNSKDAKERVNKEYFRGYEQGVRSMIGRMNYLHTL